MITIHEGTSFVQSADSGDIIPGLGPGLFYEDIRFLSQLEMKLDHLAPILLTARQTRAHQSCHFLMNPKLNGAERGTLSILRRRLVGNGMHEDIEIKNYGDQDASFELSIDFDTDFSHIFQVKRAFEIGEMILRPSSLEIETHSDQGLSQGIAKIRLKLADVLCETLIYFSQSVSFLDTRARFQIRLARNERWNLCTHVELRMGQSIFEPSYTCERVEDQNVERTRGARKSKLSVGVPRLTSDHPIFNRAYERATQDFISLRIKAEEASSETTIAAGIPWFMALFGRDSLIASYQTLLHDPELAKGTLKALARLQGSKIDPVSMEEPGKILHEYRKTVTPMTKVIPKFPYYGSIDSTPLFLITLSEYVKCTGDIRLAQDLWSNIELALEWMDLYGDQDRDGLLEYIRKTESGLINQGWKDSEDSVRFHDGRIAEAPIALVEVQGYAYDALVRIASLCDRLTKPELAQKLREKSQKLRRKIISSYWLKSRNFFAEALDGKKNPVDSITSNPGHLLWSGVLPDSYAAKVVERLFSKEMYSGYGIRTMATSEGGFNPISYHNGSVWPHENSLILMGLVRYGFKSQAIMLANSFLFALADSSTDCFPELFAGYSSSQYGTPVAYPTSNRPQAWASGALVLLTRAILGLEVDTTSHILSIDPLPLPGLSYFKLEDIPVAGQRVSIEVKIRDGKAKGEIVRKAS